MLEKKKYTRSAVPFLRQLAFLSMLAILFACTLAPAPPVPTPTQGATPTSAPSVELERYKAAISPILEEHQGVMNRWRDSMIGLESKARTGQITPLKFASDVEQISKEAFLRTLIVKDAWNSITPPESARRLHSLIARSYELLVAGLDATGSCYGYIASGGSTAPKPSICVKAEQQLTESDEVYDQALVESSRVFR